MIHLGTPLVKVEERGVETEKAPEKEKEIEIETRILIENVTEKDQEPMKIGKEGGNVNEAEAEVVTEIGEKRGVSVDGTMRDVKDDAMIRMPFENADGL